MKIIQNKNMIQKIVLLLLIFVSFNFICPNIANAGTGDDGNLGGVLIGGVCDLLTALGDGVMNIIHKFAVGQEDTIIHVRADGWSIAGWVLRAVLVALATATIIALVASGVGAFVAAVMGTTLAVSKIVCVSLLVGGFAGGFYYSNIEENLDLPVYSITPEEIFYGKIPLLNVNFFNPEERKDIFDELFTKYQEYGADDELYEILKFNTIISAKTTNEEKGNNKFQRTQYKVLYNQKKYIIKEEKYSTYYQITIYKGTDEVTGEDRDNLVNLPTYENEYIARYRTVGGLNLQNRYQKEIETNGYCYKMDIDAYLIRDDFEDELKDKVFKDYGMYTINGDLNLYESLTSYLVRNNVDVSKNPIEWNLYSGGNEYKVIIENLGKDNQKIRVYTIGAYVNAAADLQPIVAKWYVTLRNVALVISMSVLVYVGIRMMLTSIAAEKAKYKTMLFDWVIGVGLMFIMQYMMVFTTSLNDEFIDLVASGTNELKGNVAIFQVNDKWDLSGLNESGQAYVVEDGMIYYPTNLMGGLRLAIQDGRNQTLTYAGMTIAFLVMVFYTAFFMFTYIKRVIYMAFLTIIAPFVAMTYPLDKINDGKAQAFNMWLKEYIFNLLIQPMHLMLYCILISSAIKLATENVLYTLVALGFLIPSEKIIRKFFGFDKAQTPGFLGGAAGAGIVMSAVGNLRRFASPGKGGHKDAAEKDTTGKNRTKDSGAKLKTEDMFNNGKNSLTDDNKSEIRTSGNSQTEKQVETKSSDELAENTATFAEQPAAVSEASEKAFAEERKVAQSDVADGAKATTPAQDKPKEKTDSKNSGDSERTFRRRLGGAIGAVGGSAGRGIMKAASKTPGLIARGYGAATLGAIGLAAGIATGDPNNALQYTLTGGAAGSAVGAGLFNRATNAAGNLQDDWVRGWYGDEYDEYLNRKSDRQFMMSKENRNFYKSMFGDEWHSKMEEAKKYRQHKVTDNKIIAKAMLKLKGYSEQERIQLAKWASGINNPDDWAKMRDALQRKHGWSDSRLNNVESGIYTLKGW